MNTDWIYCKHSPSNVVPGFLTKGWVCFSETPGLDMLRSLIHEFLLLRHTIANGFSLALYFFPCKLATGKYGCTEVRVYPAECGEQLGRDP